MLESYDWFKPEDLPDFFHALRKSPNPLVLVGGQSLTFWVQFYGIPVPETKEPYLTQDADILGTQKDAEIIAKELKGCVRIPEPDDHTPNTATIVYLTADGRKLLVDVMGVLIGLNNEEINATAVTLDHDKYGLINIIHPFLLLQSRICNLKILRQKRTGNGITQARLAVQVYRKYIENYAATQLDSNETREEYLMDRMRAIAKLARSDAGLFVFKGWAIDLMDAAPIELITHQKIS